MFALTKFYQGATWWPKWQAREACRRSLQILVKEGNRPRHSRFNVHGQDTNHQRL